VEGTNANLNGQYEQQSTAGTHYYTRTDDSMVIRMGDGGWNFCVASGGVVVEPCYGKSNRQGYVADVQNQPAASKISVWGNPGDSSISFGCSMPPSGTPACSGTRTEANPSTSPYGTYAQMDVELEHVKIHLIAVTYGKPGTQPFNGPQKYMLDLNGCVITSTNPYRCQPFPQPGGLHLMIDNGMFVPTMDTNAGQMFAPGGDPNFLGHVWGHGQGGIGSILKIHWCPKEDYFLVNLNGQMLDPLMRQKSVFATVAP